MLSRMLRLGRMESVQCMSVLRPLIARSTSAELDVWRDKAMDTPRTRPRTC